MACALMTQATYFQSNNLSAEAPAFVPSWKAPQIPPSTGNCCMINLGSYSDDSEEEEDIISTPSPAVAEAPKPIESEESLSSLRSRRPWRVSAPEFVPRASAPEFVPMTLTKNAEVSTVKSPPWRRSLLNSPKTETSSCTLSTSEGLSTPSGSVHDSSDSTASCASRSRSPTPSPAVQKEVSSCLTIAALMLWRAIPSDRPEELLPSAKEVEAERPKSQEASPIKNMEKSWRREVMPEKKLEVSDDSWVARQANRRRSKTGGEELSDEDIIRTVKCILNKLTVEKFESLSVQLLQCGICSTRHLEILIQEVFEKATTQHHFIDMYADLCDLLNIHFSEQCMIDDPKKNFKKVLLHCCQASFEKHLTPPKGLAELNHEERAVAERLYKMCMLGNIKFVGALLVRKMLASKVMLAIMEELLQSPTSEALESLAALLTVVGPTFDTPDWAYRVTLNAIFSQIQKLIKTSTIDPRTRCLLKDVLDLRNEGWKDRKPKKIEGPLKLEEVAAKAAAETGGWVQKSPSHGYSNDWETVGKERMGKLCSLLNSKATSPCTSPMSMKPQIIPQKAEKTAKATGAGAAMLNFLKNRDKADEVSEEVIAKPFDGEKCKAEISSTLAELRVSHDVPEAITRIANISVPVADQASELESLLSCLVEEGTQAVRKAGFDLVTGLVLKGHWKKEAATEGLHSFIEEVCPDLKFDVPTLGRILCEELYPALGSLVKAGMLEADQQNAVMAF